MNEHKLEELATQRKIQIHEPFAEFLHAKDPLCEFEISLLDCYRMAGHACHAITGAFLVTEAAVDSLFPDSRVCERGDLRVEFGSKKNEGATGPRSNVISYITGAWAESGFPGLRGMFKRKNLVSYENPNLNINEVYFQRCSTGEYVTIQYDVNDLITQSGPGLDFPENWRAEICTILKDPTCALRISRRKIGSVFPQSPDNS